MIIQYLATGLITIILLQLILKVIKDKTSVFKIIFWLFFWSGTLILIWLPMNFLDDIGAFFGVAKGLDLVVYISIIILFYIALRTQNKIDIQKKEITKLVREIAKDNVK